MYFKDFKCEDCNHIEEVIKARMIDDFVYDKCIQCGSTNVHMIFGNVSTDVAEGNLGNAETKYQNSLTYHPSKYGKFKGTKI